MNLPGNYFVSNFGAAQHIGKLTKKEALKYDYGFSYDDESLFENQCYRILKEKMKKNIFIKAIYLKNLNNEFIEYMYDNKIINNYTLAAGLIMFNNDLFYKFFKEKYMFLHAKYDIAYFIGAYGNFMDIIKMVPKSDHYKFKKHIFRGAAANGNLNIIDLYWDDTILDPLLSMNMDVLLHIEEKYNVILTKWMLVKGFGTFRDNLPIRIKRLLNFQLSSSDKKRIVYNIISLGGWDDFKLIKHWDIIGLDEDKRHIIHIVKYAYLQGDPKVTEYILNIVDKIKVDIRPLFKYAPPHLIEVSENTMITTHNMKTFEYCVQRIPNLKNIYDHFSQKIIMEIEKIRIIEKYLH